MYGYRCDICNAPIQVDPSDERVCAECEAKIVKSHKIAKRYAGIVRLNENQYEMNMEEIIQWEI